MFQHDAQHTGRSPFTGPVTPQLRWTLPYYEAFSSPVLGPDGTIYTLTQQGLEALNPDGTTKWVYAGSFDDSTPVVGSDGTIYVGDSPDAMQYAINPDGTLDWTVSVASLGYPINHFMVLTVDASGTVYIYIDWPACQIFAISPAGTIIWHTDIDIWTATAFYPAVGPDGTIYVEVRDTNAQDIDYGVLYALNPTTGATNWTYSPGASECIDSCPVVGSDGTIYMAFSVYSGNNASETMYAINPANGAVKWSYPYQGTINGLCPALGADGTLYFGTTTYNGGGTPTGTLLYALASSGALKWKVTPTNDVPAMGRSTVVVDAAGAIYYECPQLISGAAVDCLSAFNPDGTLKWNFPLANCSTNSGAGSMAMASNGTVYVAVASAADNLYAVIDADSLQLSKLSNIATGATVNPGDQVNYTLTFDHTAASRTIANVSLVDTLPAQMSFVSATNSGVYNSANRTVTWNIGTIAAGAPAQSVQVTLQVNSNTPYGSQITNSATISGTDTLLNDTLTAQASVNVQVASYPLPTAVAVANGVQPLLTITRNCYGGALVTLDGSQSSDPVTPTNQLTFAWDFTLDGTHLGTGMTTTYTYPVNAPGQPWTATLTVTNAHNLSSKATVSINVLNCPTLTLTAPATLTVEQTNHAGTPVTLGTPTVTDFQSGVTPTVTNNAPAVFPLGATTVTWTASDGINTPATATQLVTVQDTTPPSFTAPPDVVVPLRNGAIPPITLGTPFVVDICDTQPQVSNNAPANYAIGTTYITWTATDASGNTATATQRVVIYDPSTLTLIPPANLTVEQTNRNGTPVTLGTASVQGTTDPHPTITNDAPAVFPLGVTVVTWKAVDAHGLRASAAQQVTVQDTTPPSLQAPANITLPQTASAGTPVALGTPVVADICDAAPTVTNNAPALFPVGTTTVTWTATDASGNANTAQQQVTITATSPSWDNNVNVTLEQTTLAGAPATLLPCPTTIASPNTLVTITNNAPALLPLGETDVLWTATLNNGQQLTVTQHVTVVDTTPPTLATPAEVTVEQADRAGTVVTLAPPTVSDVCDAAPTVTNDAPATFPLGLTLVHWTACDASHNTATVVQCVRVVDTTPPVLTAPPNLQVQRTTLTGTPLTQLTLGTPRVSDICDAAPTVTNDAPAVFPVGVTPVTWSACDASGNVATAVQQVMVVDASTLILQAPNTVTAEQTNRNGTPVSLGTPVIHDPFDPNPSVQNNAPAVFPLGATTVTWTATDAAGHRATATQQVTIVDTTPPLIIAPPDVTAEQANRNGTTLTSTTLGTPQVSDICDAAPSVTNNAPASFPLGLTTVTWSARDASGNVATAVQHVTIVDTTPPSLTAPADISVTRTGLNGTPVTAAVLGTPVVADICDAHPSLTNDAPALFPVGVTTVTWTATDASGNRASAQQHVTVIDTSAPTFATLPNVTSEQTNRNGTPVALALPTVTDSFDPNPSLTNNAPAVFPLGATTVTWTATDVSGHTATATQQVTIVDTTPPLLQAPADVVAEQANRNGTTVSLGQATATDICECRAHRVEQCAVRLPARSHHRHLDGA